MLRFGLGIVVGQAREKATVFLGRERLMSEKWIEKIEGGEIVLIDGATGTELQRR